MAIRRKSIKTQVTGDKQFNRFQSDLAQTLQDLLNCPFATGFSATLSFNGFGYAYVQHNFGSETVGWIPIEFYGPNNMILSTPPLLAQVVPISGAGSYSNLDPKNNAVFQSVNVNATWTIWIYPAPYVNTQSSIRIPPVNPVASPINKNNRPI